MYQLNYNNMRFKTSNNINVILLSVMNLFYFNAIQAEAQKHNIITVT